MTVEKLDWDSENFGYQVGQFKEHTSAPTPDELLQAVQQAKAEGYKLLYLKHVELPAHCLTEGIVLADRKVTYSQFTRRAQVECAPQVHSVLHQPLNAQLLYLALQSGGHSRFYTDPKMPLQTFLYLYRAWIDNSLKGLIATDVLVYGDSNNPEGLLTYKLRDGHATIGLVCTESRLKRKGIGTSLMQTFLNRLEPGTRVSVDTQLDNVQACRFYEKNGFKIESVTNIYHIWVDDYIKNNNQNDTF